MSDYEILGKKYYSLVSVAKKLAMSYTKVFKLVQHKKLKTIRIGGSGKHFVEYSELERFMADSISGKFKKEKENGDNENGRTETEQNSEQPKPVSERTFTG